MQQRSPRVEDWFWQWLGRHMKRHPILWPPFEEAAEFYDGFRSNLIRHGIVEDVADEASIALMVDPPAYRDRHVQAIVTAAQEIFKTRAADGKGGMSDPRHEAVHTSKGCEDCDGGGLVIRYRRLSAADSKCPSIVLYCVCPFGRWLRGNHRTTSKDVYARCYDLAEYPWLEGDEYRKPPLAVMAGTMRNRPEGPGTSDTPRPAERPSRPGTSF